MIKEKLINLKDSTTRAARLTIEIKKRENEIESIYIDLGKLVILQKDNGASVIDLNNAKIAELYERLNECKRIITENTEEVGKLKSSIYDQVPFLKIFN